MRATVGDGRNDVRGSIQCGPRRPALAYSRTRSDRDVTDLRLSLSQHSLHDSEPQTSSDWCPQCGHIPVRTYLPRSTLRVITCNTPALYPDISHPPQFVLRTTDPHTKCREVELCQNSRLRDVSIHPCMSAAGGWIDRGRATAVQACSPTSVDPLTHPHPADGPPPTCVGTRLGPHRLERRLQSSHVTHDRARSSTIPG